MNAYNLVQVGGWVGVQGGVCVGVGVVVGGQGACK